MPDTRARVAAIDCGTNSIRLLVTDVSGDQKSDVLRDMRVAKALGRTVAPRPLPVAVLSAYARLEETLAPVFRREPDLTRETVTLLSSNIYCDTSRAVEELGFECVDMDSMLNDTIEWMLSEGMLKSISRSIPSA